MVRPAPPAPAPRTALTACAQATLALLPIALTTAAESLISFTVYGVLFPNLRRRALAAEGKPDLTAASGVAQGPHAVTHEQTAAEQIMTKHAPSMVITFLKVDLGGDCGGRCGADEVPTAGDQNYLLAATLKTLNIRDPVDAAVFAGTLWTLKELPVLADECVSCAPVPDPEP
ncbi:hypothetical protein DFJ74DRAFT_701524 [Hyaloraphidium curvatum]|nr:hypothetical protein DFJ74DRAFT_701524 [Hyaloraphidium curvatum]